MPDVSIAISAQDSYSSAIKSMAQITKSFSKDMDEMEGKLSQLNKNRYSLKMDLREAQKKLSDAEKQFQKTKKAKDELARDDAQANFDRIQRNLALVTKGAREAENQMKKTGEAFRKVDNQGGSGGGFKSIVSSLAAAGAGNMIAGLAQNAANTMVGSALGSAGGTLFSNALSSAISGAAIGNVVPGVGAAVGAVLGTAVGIGTGIVQNFEKKDDAFKSYYGGLYSSAVERRSAELEEGSSIAGSRESTRLAFNKLLGGETEASEYLKRVEALAVDTNYGYDEITGYTKLLLNNFQPDQVLDILMDLSDATAGLSLSSADVAQFISGLNRMTTAGKATREWLSYFDDRGLNTSDALASYLHVDKSRIADMVTGGEVTGEQAVAAIRAYIQREYGGLSAELAGSYDAMKDNLEDAMDGIGAALGAAFNEKNKEGVGADLAAYGDTEEGGLGAALVEMNGMIGEGMAIADNLSRQYQREAMNALLLGDETTVYGEEQDTALQEMHGRYAALKSEWDDLDEKLVGENLTEEARRTYEERQGVIGKELEALKGEAESLAEAAYDAGDLSQTVKDVELELISAIRENTLALGTAAYLGDYEKQQEQSRGTKYTPPLDPGEETNAITSSWGKRLEGVRGRYAYGLDYVPYDNFPALLHQGERVLTASQARAADQGAGPRVQVTVTGNSFYGSDKDLEDRVARRVASEVVRAVELGV
ncbi:tape measure protein [Intestinimonas butyriciproducens]|uniref:Tape measure protein N-terminal domain-containing protein n=1 Tax=Intestinimonas butyriciproducens TaxID=1297617 RepID=A0A0S2W5L7_9FIRM|nr:tape measure protein [Intestinimonas butyriciproducens]ALP94630.1 hypothetical protein IB211_02239c [Intestinimonas butyriciproducens]